MLGRFISATNYLDFLARGRREASPLLEFEPDTMKSHYNRAPFQITHRLADHPYFSLEELFALCRRMPPEMIPYRIGSIPGDADLDSSYDRYKKELTLDDVLDHFEDNSAYICINNPERDAQFRPLIEGLLSEITAQIDPLDPWISWYSTYIFISTRDSVTPYHMDREMNFLLHIRGNKTVHLWDPSDNEIMSPAQKDLLLSRVGDRPAYHPSFESKAMTFALKPGVGLHHPFIAPHRVHTGPELAVSLALTFRTQQSDRWTDAHRFNARMRRWGMNPTPVGSNVLMDRAKSGITRMGQRARRTPASVDAP